MRKFRFFCRTATVGLAGALLSGPCGYGSPSRSSSSSTARPVVVRRPLRLRSPEVARPPVRRSRCARNTRSQPRGDRCLLLPVLNPRPPPTARPQPRLRSAGARESSAPAKPASALLSGCMGVWSWMSTLDERLGIRPRRGPFDCAWCVRNEHGGCTGLAVRPRIPGGTASSIHRLQAENDACACHLRGHQVQR